MTRTRLLAATSVAAALILLITVEPACLAGATGPASPTGTPSRLPMVATARQGAQWLAGNFTTQGYIPTAPGSAQPDLSSTAQSVLALSAANVDLATARSGLAYLEGHVNAFATSKGVDIPGKLAVLILDAEALGADPQAFGGSDLVARLLATEQQVGPDRGLFGTEAQAADFAAGGYTQGLALTALAAADVRGPAPAVDWLIHEQCPDGGWTAPDNTDNACDGTPADFGGPDTNSTALALEGLAAQGAVTPTISGAAIAFLASAQDPDGGWSYFPNTRTTPGSTDPDSTALVIQALIALGVSPTGPRFTKAAGDPVSALLSFRLTSGRDAGAFYFPPAPAPASLVATYQAVPALAGLASPFGPAGHSYWEVASDGGIFAFGDAGFFGSMGGSPLNARVVGMAATPDGRGYWEVASDGGIFAFGDAGFFGSMGGTPLNAPVVGMAASPDGLGYWEVAADGGIFAFGDAGFFGSTGGTPLNAPVVGMVATPDGRGYWEVASDGGIFAFGDAGFFGSTGGTPLNAPVVGMAASPDGLGYWEVAADGGIFNEGDAGFFGSTGGTPLNRPMVGMAGTPDGLGYWLVASDGGIFSLGDAGFYGSTGGTPLNAAVVGMAASPGRPAGVVRVAEG